ncbi:hypothetical protein GCM10009663_60210 [Kitasatospora arboriphila]|uniref:Uncharacterized protein n=1 Tax=Kitasatospora arboriphila TaxID=258052 RepID=A0ABN1TZU6_9ACTN
MRLPGDLMLRSATGNPPVGSASEGAARPERVEESPAAQVRSPQTRHLLLAAKFETILPHSAERQRRLLIEAEARSLGHSEIRLVAQAAAAWEATVSLGVRELESGRPPRPAPRRPSRSPLLGDLADPDTPTVRHETLWPITG